MSLSLNSGYFRSIPHHFPFLELVSNFYVLCTIIALRKFTIILTALVIVISSTGTTIAFHYCGKSLQDIAVLGKAKPCCGGIEMPSGCCHDEKVEIKSDNFTIASQVYNAGFVSFLVYEIAFPVLDFSLHFQNSQSNFLTHLDKSHPPDGPDIVILVQSFLI